MSGRVLVLDERDNVAVAVDPLAAGDAVTAGGATVAAVEPIPPGHKIALAPIGEGEPVLKYGEVIGRATAPIARGGHVHVHNVVSARLP